MRNSIEDGYFGSDEEFHRRLNEFYHHYFERSRRIFRMILRSPSKCWSIIKSLPGSIKNKFLKQYIAMIMLFLSFGLLCVVFGFLHPIGIIYCLSFVICCAISLRLQKGLTVAVILEHRRLLEQRSDRNRQDADQPAEDKAKNKTQSSQWALETLMEPRQGCEAALSARSAYQVQYDFHRSDMHTPLNYNISAGSSHNPDPFPSLVYGSNSEGTSKDPDPFQPLNYNDTSTEILSSDPSPFYKSTAEDATSGTPLKDASNSFVLTQFSVDSYDSEEPLQRLSQARLAVAAVKTFGEPAQIFGADSYTVLLSSDEHCTTTSSDSGPTIPKTFVVSAEVHPDLCKSVISSNDDQPASITSDENAREMAGSDLHRNIPYMDDPSSETTCSTPLDEESTQTED